MKQNDDLQGEDGVGTSPAAFRQPEGGDSRATPLILPPNTSLERFRDFMRRIEEIVGVHNATVISSDAELQHDSYMDPSKAHDMFYVASKDFFISAAVVAPRDVPEVQSIVRLCNEFEIPLWPFSIGRNVGYGESKYCLTAVICLIRYRWFRPSCSR